MWYFPRYKHSISVRFGSAGSGRIFYHVPLIFRWKQTLFVLCTICQKCLVFEIPLVLNPIHWTGALSLRESRIALRARLASLAIRFLQSLIYEKNLLRAKPSEARRARRAILASRSERAPVQCMGFRTRGISKTKHFWHMVHGTKNVCFHLNIKGTS